MSEILSETIDEKKYTTFLLCSTKYVFVEKRKNHLTHKISAGSKCILTATFIFQLSPLTK